LNNLSYKIKSHLQRSDKQTADSGMADGDFDGRAQGTYRFRQYKISKALVTRFLCRRGTLTSED